jgi:hypothetical protein
MQAQFVKPTTDTLGKGFLIRSNLEDQQVLAKNALGNLYILAQDGMICLAPETVEHAIIPNAFPGTGNIDPQPFPFYFNRPLRPVAPLPPIIKPAIKTAPGGKISGKPLTEAELAEIIKKNREKKAPAFVQPKPVKPVK